MSTLINIKTTTKILVALSGGVDSAVVMHLLKQQFKSIVGFSHRHWPESKCCSTICIDTCRQQCQDLNIPYHTVDTMVEFVEKIVDPFVKDYQTGSTPNPCVLCNQKNRFGITIDKLLKLLHITTGDLKIATGHYARIEEHNNFFILKRGLDTEKDQSYMLYRLSQKQLSQCLFPLGDYQKEEVRKLATKYQLSAAKKPDSQDICFVKTNYRDFIQEYNPTENQNGCFLDSNGNVLGTHKGIQNYNRGQRKGIGLSGGPWFVIDIKKEKKEIILGKRKDLKIIEFIIHDCVWNIKPQSHIIYQCQVRYHGENYESSIKYLFQDNKKLYQITLKTFSDDVTKGQSAVFYTEETQIGGGIIYQLIK